MIFFDFNEVDKAEMYPSPYHTPLLDPSSDAGYRVRLKLRIPRNFSPSHLPQHARLPENLSRIKKIIHRVPKDLLSHIKRIIHHVPKGSFITYRVLPFSLVPFPAGSLFSCRNTLLLPYVSDNLRSDSSER